MGLMISIMLVVIGFTILAIIIFWGVKSLNNSTIPKLSEQKSISQMTRKELKRLV